MRRVVEALELYDEDEVQEFELKDPSNVVMREAFSISRARSSSASALRGFHLKVYPKSWLRWVTSV